MVPLMHHDPDRSWITDPDPDHSKGTHSKAYINDKIFINIVNKHSVPTNTLRGMYPIAHI